MQAREYQEMLKNVVTGFKPQYGNDSDLQLLGEYERIQRDINLISKREEKIRENRKLLKEIESIEAEIQGRVSMMVTQIRKRKEELSTQSTGL